MYEYLATVLNVVDGDTVDFSVDLGLRVRVEDRFRLLGINAPELHAADPAPGQRSKVALLTMLPVGSQVTLRTQKDRREKYGRWLATVFTAAGLDVCQAMADGGWATPWDGTGKRP